MPHKNGQKYELSFNIDKCEQSSFTRGGKDFKQQQYTLLNKKCKTVNGKKDLGIIFQSDGTFNKHNN